MSDTFEKLNSKFSILSSKINDQSKKFFQFILLNGQSLCRKGKMQYEIEKLKWELKQKYNILGQYVFDQKKMNSTTDFSHNEYFLDLINDINKIYLYIDELKKKHKMNTNLDKS